MLKYIGKRILFLLPVILGVSFVVFTMLYITPGDPARMALGQQASEEAVQNFREAEGLNDPFLVQYGRYVMNAVKGDLGTSYTTKLPVVKEILNVFPNTLKITLLSMAIAIIIGIPFGVLSAVKQYTFFDSVIMFFAMVGISMPVFWLGLILILVFSVQLGLLPPSGFYGFKYMILPAITLSAQAVAIITRMTRSSMLEVIRQDYIRTVRAKGQKEGRVIGFHALKNALIPIITVIGTQFGYLLGGAILTEVIFSINGVGRLMVEAIKMRNYPVVQGGVLFTALAFSIVNLLVDLLYAYVDPRIKAQYK